MLKEMGKLAEAEVCLRRAIELDEALQEAHSTLGVVLLKLGRHQEGLEAQERGDGVISFSIQDGVSIR